MDIVYVEQGTEAWHAARAGKVTASRIADIMRKGRGGGLSESRKAYAGELVAERLTGLQTETFSSKAMDWGKQTEDQARKAYAFMRDVTVKQVGMVLHPHIENAAASPDSLVDPDGNLEIKCPNPSTHIHNLLGGEIDKDYFLQMQWQMACTGAKWTDYVSFDPRMPAEMQLCVQRVRRDPILIADLEREVREFLTEVDNLLLRLKSAYGAA